MAKIQIKSEKLTPFGGIFSIMEQFDSILSSVIDSTLGIRDFFIFCEFAFDLYKRDIRLPVAS